jgi:Tol biopolymer transport system component
MKRLLLVLVPLALLVSACAVGDPKPATYVSDIGATLNGDVYSGVAGDTEYWWRYGQTVSYDVETPHRTLAISDDSPHPVSEPVNGLTPDTTYHSQMCVEDQEEDPPRTVCSTDRTFTTAAAGGRSGLAYGFGGDGNLEVYVADADGSNQTNLSNDPGYDLEPTWSPDGRRIAFFSTRGPSGIWVMDADGSSKTNLTHDPGGDRYPAWSPDGSRIAFTSFRDGNSEVYVMDADGSNQTNLSASPGGGEKPAWSPDGRRIVFNSTGPSGNRQIYVMDADGSNQTNLTNTPSNDYDADWSPDGSKIAFGSPRDGNWGVYLMDADGSNQIDLTNTHSPVFGPAWSPRP